MSNITYKSCHYLFILQPEKFTHVTPYMFIFVELFCPVGEQIGFKVLVFVPASPAIDPGRCSFLSILDSSIFMTFF